MKNVCFFQDGKTELSVVPPKFYAELEKGEVGAVTAGSNVTSPMPGICDKILVKPGDQVTANQPVAVIIAMKMEHVLKAPKDGVVDKVNAQVGDSVAKGAVIVSFETDEEPKN